MSSNNKPGNPDEALISEQWSAASRQSIVVDAKTFYRMPKKGTFTIITGHSGGAIVVRGDGAPSNTSPALKDFMTMEETAKAVRRSYSWVSRHWKATMRLTPHHIGATLFFKRAEVEGYIERNVLRRKPVGRPKRIVGVIHYAQS